MSKIKSLAIAVVAAATLSTTAATVEAAALTNGPNGMQPNTMASRNRTSGINAKMPSRAMMHHHRRH